MLRRDRIDPRRQCMQLADADAVSRKAWEAMQLLRPAVASIREPTTCTAPATRDTAGDTAGDTTGDSHSPSRTVCFVLPSACSRPMVPHALPIVCRMKYMSAGPGSRPPAAAAHITGMASAHQAACFRTSCSISPACSLCDSADCTLLCLHACYRPACCSRQCLLRNMHHMTCNHRRFSRCWDG